MVEPSFMHPDMRTREFFRISHAVMSMLSDEWQVVAECPDGSGVNVWKFEPAFNQNDLSIARDYNMIITMQRRASGKFQLMAKRAKR